MINCIVIDDLPNAVELLSRHIEKMPGIHLQATFTAPLEALEYLQGNKTDLIFLDEEMPDISGLQFMDLIPKSNHGLSPLVVFTTGQQIKPEITYQYMNVVGFLSKPIFFEKFAKAIQNVRQIMESRNIRPVGEAQAVTREGGVLGNSDGESIFVETFVKRKKELHRILHHDLLYVKSDRMYQYLKTDSNKMICVRNYLSEIEQKLPPHIFFRVHKSYIINITRVVQIDKDSVVIFDTGENVPIGETYKNDIYERLSPSLIKS